MRGARTDTYRLVWCHLFELEPGAKVTTTDVDREAGPFYNPKSVVRALRVARACGLVRKVSGPSSAFRVITWERARLPQVLTIEWMIHKGATLTTASNVIRALESARYIRFTGAGYTRTP